MASRDGSDDGGISISPHTRIATLLGDPVDHSLSPRIQNAALRAAGIDAVYLALRCSGSTLPGLLRGIAGGGGVGNVTLPHKLAAAAAVDRATETVARTGACNTFWGENDRVVGDNTDVTGFRAAVATLLDGTSAGARVLLLGAGGAARAALCGFADDRADEVVIHNRTRVRAEELAHTPAAAGVTVRVVTNREALREERFDLVVNATSLGLGAADPPPLRPDEAREIGAALDMVYAPEETAWVRALRGAGIAAADGGEMLVRQAAASFELWWDQAAPVEEMRAALRRD